MLRRLIAVCVVAMFLAPAVSSAGFKQGDWTLSLSGSGVAQKDAETFNLSIDAGPDYFITDQIAIGLKNSLNINDGGSDRSGSIRINGDYHFDLDKWVPFVGANIGYQYGDLVDDSWICGPEGGVKYFLNSTTYVDAHVAYEWDLNNGIDFGAFFYGIGIGVRL